MATTVEAAARRAGTVNRTPQRHKVGPDGAYAAVEAGAGRALPGDDPAERTLRETCEAFGVQPITTDPVTEHSDEAPSTLGTG
jgi:hypothetical protein